MSVARQPGAADATLVSLFLEDAAQNGALLCDGLANLANGAGELSQLLPELSAAAQSVRSAARIVGCQPASALAESLERSFRRLESGELPCSPGLCHALLAAAQLLTGMGALQADTLKPWLDEHEAEFVFTLDGMSLPGSPAPAAPRAPLVGAVALASAPAPVLSLIPAVDGTIMALFRSEAEACVAMLSSGLVQLETGGSEVLEELMRAAHSFKGAARVVGVGLATRVAHALEECFVAAQRAEINLRAQDVDVLLSAVDLLSELSTCSADGLNQWQAQRGARAALVVSSLAAIARGEVAALVSEKPAPMLPAVVEALVSEPTAPLQVRADAELINRRVAALAARPEEVASDRVVKVAAASINRLMGLAGESLVESRRIQSLNGGMKRLKRTNAELTELLAALGGLHAVREISSATPLLGEAMAKALECRTLLTQEIADMDAYARRVDDLSERLYREAQKSRMRPFGDCVHGLPRTMRDVARKLGKQAKLQVVGESTHVDRDVLESLDGPLNHLLRNALDHGVEAPDERTQRGKPEEASIRLEARHHAGLLRITIADDGRGIDPEALRRKIVQKGLLNEAMAAELSVAEIMEFIFLPGFSTAAVVTEISGRGVGLDAVRSAMQAASGTVRVTSQLGRGTSFHLELPVTRSVLRAVVTAIDGEAYAFPLLRIERILRVPERELRTLGSSQFFVLHEQNIALVSGRQLLGFGADASRTSELCVVVFGEGSHRYGLVVDKFIGEHDLVVRPLDKRLGKVQDIAAAAILMDGSPALIFDTDDLLRSIEKLAHSGRIDQLAAGNGEARASRKRVLVVDDSITVREAERQLLVNNGYEVDVAVDGVDGWNSLAASEYDLVVSDVDMPRMNGLDLVRSIRRDARLAKLPIIIVSYKDRQEDRVSGLDAGANCYLTKSSFHDDTLVEAVEDLIGKGES